MTLHDVVPDEHEQDDRDSLYRAAIELVCGGGDLLQRAHTHLFCGELLRRRGRRSDARPHLRLAQRLFEEIDETALAERARREAELTAERGRPRNATATVDLTAQERAVAGLAASGVSNRVIAQELFVSPSTVDYHLRKVFRKLGITSRRRLRQALG